MKNKIIEVGAMNYKHTHTFSMVARDEESGKICVGGTSHWFAYATLVPFIEAEVGAIATQAECNLSYGAEGLSLLKSGVSVEDVVAKLITTDDEKEVRQLLVLDVNGNTAAHTGGGCVNFASHYCERNLAIAGNMLANNKVIDEMVEFYRQSTLPFEMRVIRTLQKGQEAGGDVRGKRSAGLLVAEGGMTGDYWKGIVYDLRTDDNKDPLEELERLYEIATAYQFMNLGDVEYYEKKNKSEAVKQYKKAADLMPENPETKFWYAKLLWDMGEMDKSKEVMSEVVKYGDRWVDYWQRVTGDKL